MQVLKQQNNSLKDDNINLRDEVQSLIIELKELGE